MSLQKHDYATVIHTIGNWCDIPPLEPLGVALLHRVTPYGERPSPVNDAIRAYKRGFKHCAYKHCNEIARKETMTNVSKSSTPYWICEKCAAARAMRRKK